MAFIKPQDWSLSLELLVSKKVLETTTSGRTYRRGVCLFIPLKVSSPGAPLAPSVELVFGLSASNPAAGALLTLQTCPQRGQVLTPDGSESRGEEDVTREHSDPRAWVWTSPRPECRILFPRYELCKAAAGRASRTSSRLSTCSRLHSRLRTSERMQSLPLGPRRQARRRRRQRSQVAWAEGGLGAALPHPTAQPEASFPKAAPHLKLCAETAVRATTGKGRENSPS